MLLSEHLWKLLGSESSEYLWQFSEVVGTFSEIRVIWKGKSHALDVENVGRSSLSSNLVSLQIASLLVPGTLAQMPGWLMPCSQLSSFKSASIL